MENGDSPSKKPVDYVAQVTNANKLSKKIRASQIKWLNEYQWLLEEYKSVEEEIEMLCEEKRSGEEDKSNKMEKRSVRPFPETSNQIYGWLAAKSEFNLEKYGSYIVNYPNPLDNKAETVANIPALAPGKPFIL